MENELLKSVWPEWEIESQLGRGSYGVVYKAVRRDNNVESYSAIKIISIPLDSSEADSLMAEGVTADGTKTFFHGIVNDFVSEIQLMQTFKGIQNIVSIEDYKVIEKTDEIGWYIIIRMELLTPFNTYIRDNKMSEKEVIKLGKDICTALEICGKKNIIHRDIKPENIFLNDFGDFKLGDFGIARNLENSTGGLSQKGTFFYVAPEVANSTQYDYRADIYSLGIVLYRMLNGNRLPFLDNDNQVLNPNDRKVAIDRRLRGETLPAPCEASACMANIILRACAYNMNQRFSTASDMKNALIELENGTYNPVEIDTESTVLLNFSQPGLEATEVLNESQAQRNINPNVVNTFSETPKKKKSPIIGVAIGGVVAVLAVLLLTIIVVAGAIFLPKIFNGNNLTVSKDSDNEIIAEDVSNNDVVINDDESIQEDVNNIIAEAVEFATNGSYKEAYGSIKSGLEKYPDAVDLKSKEEEYETIINEINGILENADSYAASGYYEEAINIIKLGLEKYPASNDLKEKQDEYETIVREEAKKLILADAEDKASGGDYFSATTIIEEAIETYGEDLDFKKAYDNYNQKYNSIVKSEALQSAEELATNGNYIDAVKVLNEAISEIGNDQELSAKASEYENTYAGLWIKNADDLMAKKDYSFAIEILNNSLAEFPDNSALKEKLAEIESLKPVSLASLEPLNYGQHNMDKRNWNTDAPVDPFGNDYSSSINYRIFEQEYGYDSYYWGEYRLYGEYKEISGKLSPYTSIGQKSTIFFQVFADDNLVYTSPEISRKTDQFSFLVNISEAEYITIKVSGGTDYSGGALIISDVLLWP